MGAWLPRIILWLAFTVQVAAFSDGWDEWCLWCVPLATGLAGLLVGARPWFCGSDLFWLVYLLLFAVAPSSQFEYDRFLGELSVRGLTFTWPAIQATVGAVSVFGMCAVIVQRILRPLRFDQDQPVAEGPTASATQVSVLLLTNAFLLATILAGLDTWRFIIEGRNYPARLFSEANSISTLVNAFYQLIPLAAFLLALDRWLQVRSPWDRNRLLIAGVFLAMFSNPFNTARFQMAAVLFILGMFLWRGRLPLGVSIAGILLLLLVLMPVMNGLRRGVSAGLEVDLAATGYRHLDFDSFSMAAHGMVRAEDPSFGTPGRYLISGFLFFVPRSLWPEKAQPSSIDLGRDLMAHAQGWFDNLATPVFVDFYFDLGWLGVALGGALVGWAVASSDRVIDAWGTATFRARILACSWIGFLPIVLRGSLGAVIGYFVGAAAVFLTVDALVRWTARRR